MKAIERKLFALVFSDPDTAGEAGANLLRMEGEDRGKWKKQRHHPARKRRRAVTKLGFRANREGLLRRAA